MASITRRSHTSRDARRDEMRARLLRVVEELAVEGEGYTELSVERLVQAAGISRSTFYVYFEDKGDLLRAWFESIGEELLDAIAAWWDIDGSSSRDDVRAVLANVVQTYRPHTVLMQATYDTAVYDDAVGDVVDEVMDRNVKSLRKHIAAGQKAGFVDPGLPALETAGWLQWMAERGFDRLVAGASDAATERLIDAYTAIVWNTLYAPAR